LTDADTVAKVAELLGVTPEVSPRLDGGYWRAEAVPQGHIG
jgi:hypothetical protein